jgi:hypothetical protein
VTHQVNRLVEPHAQELRHHPPADCLHSHVQGQACTEGSHRRQGHSVRVRVSVCVQIEEDQVLASPPVVTWEVLPVDLEPGPCLLQEQCCHGSAGTPLRTHANREASGLEEACPTLRT